jgi:methionyl-tRNA formyltransferase
MKVIFMGTPDFSVPSLQYLINSNHDLIAVFTQPDKKQGRGQKIKPSPVKSLANRYNIKVLQPSTLKGGEFLDYFFDADVVIVIAYGLILPVEYLNAPKYGCLNIHASLLPRWRGAAPIQRAIAAGDKLTGVCLMKMNEGLDTGPVFSKKTCVIQKTQLAYYMIGL